MKKSLLFWIAVLLMFGGAMVIYAAWQVTQRGGIAVAPVGQTSNPVDLTSALDPKVKLTRFEFTERDGEGFSSDELKGQVYVASFFFASCPATCRAQNEKMQTLQRLYAGQDVRFLSITCDPQTDTPDVLTRYAEMFNADKDQWLFLTGDLNYTTQVGHNYFGVPVARQGHTEKFIVVDRAGNIRGYFHWAKPDEFAKLQKLIDELLAESPEQAAAFKSAESDVDAS